MQALLALEDGTVFDGEGFGAETTITGEVVFNTSLTGYQEMLTDPSYRGQILSLTAPHVGNVGVNPDDVESAGPQAAALVVREISPAVSSWRAAESLPAYLARHGVPGMSEVDTRALTRRIRDGGLMKAALSTAGAAAGELVEMARAWPGLDGCDMVAGATCPSPYAWRDPGPASFSPGPRTALEGGGPHVVVFDFGTKWSILRRLAGLGCRVTVVPAHLPAEAALALRPDGIVLSNGPGDPAALPYAVAAAAALIETGLPLFGICLGHQILALAAGGRTHRLKFGHHGGNQPVQEAGSGRVLITSQNHNYTVDPAGLDTGRVEVTHRNLNDGTVEGLRWRAADRPVFSVQYHPEASPGPHDAGDLFARFVNLMLRPHE